VESAAGVRQPSLMRTLQAELSRHASVWYRGDMGLAPARYPTRARPGCTPTWGADGHRCGVYQMVCIERYVPHVAIVMISRVDGCISVVVTPGRPIKGAAEEGSGAKREEDREAREVREEE
jgi:hypothetical protein